jgi:hypothetical protein
MKTNLLGFAAIILTFLAFTNANAYEFKYKQIHGCSINNHECRQSEALERIAAALEWMADSYTEEAALRTTTASSSRINGRSLKAVPTQVEEDRESLDECIEKCWHHLMNSEIKRCTKECIKE